MRMRQVKHYTIERGGNMQFKPGGFHLMVFGVEMDRITGNRFPITLEFAGGIEQQIEVEFRPRS